MSNIYAGQAERAAYVVSRAPELLEYAKRIVEDDEATRSTLAEATYALANATVGFPRSVHHPNEERKQQRRELVIEALLGVLGRRDLQQADVWRVAVSGLVTFTSMCTDKRPLDPKREVRLDEDLERLLLQAADEGTLSRGILSRLRGEEAASVGARKVVRLMERFISLMPGGEGDATTVSDQ